MIRSPIRDAVRATIRKVLRTGEGWTPAQAQPAAWFDAADTNTITEVGGAVSKWSDKSGNGNDVAQGTTLKQPITGSSTLNGLNALYFDGTNSSLTATSGPQPANNNTMVFVVHDGAGAGAVTDGRLYNCEISSGSRFLLGYYTNELSFNNRSTFNPVDTTSLAGPRIAEGYRNGTEMGVGFCGNITATSQNGDAVGTIDRWNIGSFNDGQTSIFNGIICEVIIFLTYDLQLRQKIEGYLAHKWGLTANLPSDHPYKTNPPFLS